MKVGGIFTELGLKKGKDPIVCLLLPIIMPTRVRITEQSGAMADHRSNKVVRRKAPRKEVHDGEIINTWLFEMEL